MEAGPQGPLADDAYQRVPSSGAKYASHRFRVLCQSAEEVLDLYARVKAVDGGHEHPVGTAWRPGGGTLSGSRYDARDTTLLACYLNIRIG